MITPALQLLRGALPDAAFWFWGPEFNAELFGREKNFGGFLPHPKGQGFGAYARLTRSLRAHRFDAAVLFATQLRDVAICRLAGIPRVVGTLKKEARFLLDGGLRYEPARHRVSHYALLAEAAFASGYRHLPQMHLEPRQSDLTTAFRGPRIGLLLGGPHKGLRSYPPELAARLLELLRGLSGHVFVLGDHLDAEAAARWLPSKDAPDVHVLAGKTTVGGLADAIAGLDALVTIDTGALHLAAALDVAFVSLVGFGTSAYCTVRPQSARGVHLLPPDGVFRDQDWIQSLLPERVLAAVQLLLERREPATIAPYYGFEPASSPDNRLLSSIPGPGSHLRRDN
ncbi:MAG TPA: glycosyltransferase family 9 protein [Solimonas sp.]|nr:glycosyltransferase family 9 protein [Solimonas sp.]